MTFRRIDSTFRSILLSGFLIEGGILLIAAALRLWALDLKPPHFDEGINGWFIDQMRANGCYRYDPENYHGPFYFYILFVSLSLFGRNLWALRLPSVLASIASVWMVLRYDRYVGAVAARWGALALAVSPAALFFARYAIHESWVVLGLLVTTWGIMGLWKAGRRKDLVVTVAGITLLLLLKETAVIHIACFVLAAVVMFLRGGTDWTRGCFIDRGGCFSRDLVWCLLGAIFALMFFYSGTFLNMHGMKDFFMAYAKWFHTGTGEGGHVKSDYQLGPLNYYWIALMARYEWPSLLGAVYALRLLAPVGMLSSGMMMRYLGIYGLGALAAYSVIPYKTPWCIISILWPFSILFGCAIQEGWKCRRWRLPVMVLSLFLLGASLLAALRLNFKHFVDPLEPYVYVQTMPEISRVTEPVLAAAQADPRKYAMGGQIILESYYPLPWIFGDFTRIGYYDKMPDSLDGEFIIALSSQQKEVEDHLKEPYLRRRFHLRDSMDECTVWFKESRFHDWFVNPDHGTAERVIPNP